MFELACRLRASSRIEGTRTRLADRAPALPELARTPSTSSLRRRQTSPSRSAIVLGDALGGKCSGTRGIDGAQVRARGAAVVGHYHLARRWKRVRLRNHVRGACARFCHRSARARAAKSDTPFDSHAEPECAANFRLALGVGVDDLLHAMRARPGLCHKSDQVHFRPYVHSWDWSRAIRVGRDVDASLIRCSGSGTRRYATRPVPNWP
jgi:hypothetical protein